MSLPQTSIVLKSWEQAIPEDSTVSIDVSLPPGTTSAECQTDLTTDEIEYLITELEECRKKITILDRKVENKKRLKRELNTEDMQRHNESVKFYTGVRMVFASTATVSSSCSTQLSCDINFVSSASVTAAAVVCGSNWNRTAVGTCSSNPALK